MRKFFQNHLNIVGPDGWATTFPESCAGLKNSPIALSKGIANPLKANSWKLTGWDQQSTYKVLDEEFASK